MFDSACAAAQVERKNVVSYTPAILDVFRDLVTTSDAVAAALEKEKRALGLRPKAVDELGLKPTTQAGKFVQALGPRSDETKLEALCRFSADDEQRLQELVRALRDDPLARAQAEETRARRLGEFMVEANRASELLSDAACAEYEARVETQATTQRAAAAATAAFAEQPQRLAGVGSEEWRALWEAARAYSESHAYGSESFPVVGEGARCVLCHQELAEEAAERLGSFEEFVKAEVQRAAEKASTDLKESAEALGSLALPRSVRVSLQEAGLLAEAQVAELRRFLVGAKRRRRYLERFHAGSTVARPTLTGLPELSGLQREMRAEAERCRAASREEDRKELEAERDELEARKELAKHKGTLADEIQRLRQRAVLNAAIDDCKTTGITRKSGDAAKLIVTGQLRSNFTTNLTSLGFGHTPVEVKHGGGDKATHPYELKLMARPDIPCAEVLSESERTCVALAGLLAELETTKNRSALVLDDPVSSLDQPYRKRVAERLVLESKERQVVVFTHDVVFLYLLRKYARELGATVNEVSLSRGYKKNHGQVTGGPPWEAMGVRDRIKRLREELTTARQRLKEGSDWSEYQVAGARLYRRLRQSWERAVEEVLLNQTVLRFGDSVQTNRLAKLTDITDEDIELVSKEMSRCSDFVHDEAEAVHTEVPEASVVEEDIRKLDDWVKRLRKERGRS